MAVGVYYGLSQQSGSSKQMTFALRVSTSGEVGSATHMYHDVRTTIYCNVLPVSLLVLTKLLSLRYLGFELVSRSRS